MVTGSLKVKSQLDPGLVEREIAILKLLVWFFNGVQAILMNSEFWLADMEAFGTLPSISHPFVLYPCPGPRSSKVKAQVKVREPGCSAVHCYSLDTDGK
jgi:hypothetical protein